MASFNYGLASVIAVLKQSGYFVKLVVVEDDIRPKDIIREIIKFNADIIGFSCMSNYWQYVKNLSEMIKLTPQLKDKLIFVGGTHSIVCPQSIQESEHIDAFCIGEGEYAALEAVEKISQGRDFYDTPGFHFRTKQNEIIKNEARMMIGRLDDLPFPDRDVFPEKVFINYANFTFSRGCPYSCSYCCNSVFNTIFRDKGNRIRCRSVSKALEEIEIFLKKYESDMLSFDDDCFNKNRQWFREFCLKYKARVSIPYACNTRPEFFDRETAQMLKESGCKKISIGVESGDENLRRTVLNRDMKDEQIIMAFEYAREAGLETMSFNMIGFPGETKESIRKTIELNKRIKPTYVQVSTFYPYAGTPLGELCKEKNYLDDERGLFTYFGKGSSILNLPNLSKKDIKDLFFRFELEIYNSHNFGRAYIAKKIRYAVSWIYKYFPRPIKNILRIIKSNFYETSCSLLRIEPQLSSGQRKKVTI